MAMDHFKEEVVVKHNNTLNKIVYYLSWIIIIAGALFAAMMLGTLTTNFNWMSLIFIVVSGGVAAYTYFFHDRLLTEYEYTFTNGALDFAEVYNNKKLRKGYFSQLPALSEHARDQADELVPEPGSGAVLLLLHQGYRQEDDHPRAQ